MAAELLKQTVKCRRMLSGGVSVREETAETIVPDTYPDIARIVDVQAMILLREREAGVDQGDIRCAARIVVLYAPENAESLMRLELPLSFVHTAQLPGCQPGCMLMCSSRLNSVDARAVNPRKVSVRLSVGFDVHAYGESEETIVTGAQDDAAGLETWTQPVTAVSVVAVAEKQFTMTEEVDFPDRGADFGTLLDAAMEVEQTDMRVMPGKVVFKAQAKLCCLYTDANHALRCFESTYLLSQIADVEGAGDEMDASIHFELRSFELEPVMDINGTVGYFTVNAGLTAQILLTAKRCTQILTDAFGTRCHCTLQREPYRYISPGGSELRADVSEKIEAGVEVRRVIRVSARPERSAEYTEDGRAVVYVPVTVLVAAQDGELYSITRRLPAVFSSPQIPCSTWELRISALEAVPDSAGTVTVSFRAQAVFSEGTQEEIQMVTALEIGDPYPVPEGPRIAALLCFADADEDLWQVAQRYHTRLSEIRAANHLPESAQVHAGDLLVIPV